MTENTSTPAPTTPPSFTAQEMKGALKAFKKRLKVMRLDSESGKITGPLSSGRTSSIMAITPPHQFHRDIWDALVKEGRLKYEGHGIYELVGDI